MDHDDQQPRARLSPRERIREALIALEMALREEFDVTAHEILDPAPTTGDEFLVTVRVRPRTSIRPLERVAYKSPEQVRGIALDRRSDIFSVGAVLYELLAGSPAFDATDPFDILEQIRTVKVRPLLSANPSIPLELERIVHTALAAHPAERYASAAAFAQELAPFIPSAEGARAPLIEVARFLRDRLRGFASASDTPAGRGPVPFGKYLLHEHIGDDGIAEISRATAMHEGSQRTLTIRRIMPTRNDVLITALVDTAKAATRTAHPNVVQIYDIGMIEDVFYVAHEHVEGVDLRTIVEWPRRGKPLNLMPISVPAACSLVTQVCEALEHVHRATGRHDQPSGFVHRDVRPVNILVSTTGDVKLLTLGITRALEETYAH